MHISHSMTLRNQSKPYVIKMTDAGVLCIWQGLQFFSQTVLRAQLCWLWQFQTNMFSLHFTLLNLSDDISMALLFKIRMCADIFLMHHISCYLEWKSQYDREKVKIEKLMWRTSLFPSKKTSKGKRFKTGSKER